MTRSPARGSQCQFRSPSWEWVARPPSSMVISESGTLRQKHFETGARYRWRLASTPRSRVRCGYDRGERADEDIGSYAAAGTGVLVLLSVVFVFIGPDRSMTDSSRVLRCG